MNGYSTRVLTGRSSDALAGMVEELVIRGAPRCSSSLGADGCCEKVDDRHRGPRAGIFDAVVYGDGERQKASFWNSKAQKRCKY